MEGSLKIIGENKMTCPKCGSQGENENYCGNCGNKLKEKCSECGQMEAIGRPVCETKVANSKFKADEYSTSRFFESLFSIFLFTLFLALAFSISAVRFSQDKGLMVAAAGVWGLASLEMFMFIPITYRMDKRKKNFFLLHPDYAEMIRQAEKFEKKINQPIAAKEEK